MKTTPAVEILKEMEKHKTCEYVFPSPNGGPISPDSVRHMLHRVLKRAGLPAVRFHDLRHTFATLALQNGVDIKTVSGMLGRVKTARNGSHWRKANTPKFRAVFPSSNQARFAEP